MISEINDKFVHFFTMLYWR